MRTTALILMLAAACLMAAPAAAQPPPGGRGGGRSDRPMTPEEMKQRLAWAEGMLRKMDTNGNGSIDVDEATGNQKRYIERILSRAGLEPKFPLAISQIQEAMQKSYQARAAAGAGAAGPVPGNRPPAGAAFDGRGPRSAGFPAPQGPGFGPLSKPQLVPNFGDPAAAARMGPVAATAPVANFPPATAAVVAQPAVRPADGAATPPPITTGAAKPEKPETAASTPPAAAATASPATPPAPVRKSGRFLKPTERLPKGLPDWFAAKDVDGDGQVTMAEFATEWTPEKAAEFTRYDLNHDGIITAAECLKAMKQPQ